MLFKKIQLLRGLINGEVAYTGPFFINVDITRRCNMACQGCQYHSSETRKALHGNYNVDFISLDLLEKLCTVLPVLKGILPGCQDLGDPCIVSQVNPRK